MDRPASPYLLLGSRNRHKLAEIQALLAGLPLQVLGADALPEPLEPAEDGETFEENARRKAVEFALAAALLPSGRRPRWVLSDDSGLCVEALGGAPGVRSARYSGLEGSREAVDRANNEKLLRELRGVEPARRGARFVCAVACAEVVGSAFILFEARGECAGRIGEAPRGSGGFGYDPLFLVPAPDGGRERAYAELSEEEKNRLSHRGKAFREVRQRLAALLERLPEQRLPEQRLPEQCLPEQGGGAPPAPAFSGRR